MTQFNLEGFKSYLTEALYHYKELELEDAVFAVKKIIQSVDKYKGEPIPAPKVSNTPVVKASKSNETLADIIDSFDMESSSVPHTTCENFRMMRKKDSTQIGLYCKDCGKWLKWVGKKEKTEHLLNGVEFIDLNQ